MIDQNSICVRNIQSGLNYCSSYKNVIIAPNEFEHHIFQCIPFQLSVGNTNSGFRNQGVDQTSQLHQILHPVMDEEYLPTTVYFILYSFFDQFFIEYMQFCQNRLAVWWWGADNTQIPGTHQRKMQGSWNWGRSQCEGINICPELLQFLLHTYTKFLLFINNQESEVFKFHVLTHDAVGANDNINLTFSKFLKRLFNLFCRFKPVYIINRARKITQPGLKCFKMLQCQNGCWH